MIKILSFVVSIFLLIGCSTLDVSVDYDESYDFQKVRTFAIDRTSQNPKNTLFEDRVTNALENELIL